MEQRNEPSRGPTTANTSITLASIIADKKFIDFYLFLKDQCRTHNLKFWLACKHYQQLSCSTEYLTKVANAVYAKFIQSSAPQKISLLPETKKTIKESIRLARCKDEPLQLTVELFDTAQQEICKAMERKEILLFVVFTCHHPSYMSYLAMANPICNVSVASSYQRSEDSQSSYNSKG